ncbi:hypothetical protein GGTG_14266 [Gaeumannomyces tritici R3-111a-1]|uniref:Uncharacterized protein n=1 Tax=Gaeumannomyces tritici (strain R3-111a-1) TaxID=644352 RepID=J3PL26_GAET3|nr:hypothetical protein GGTG_14266 [Gaeumannomyces tritici R3-111a-1]EJT68156.1 hypothetical protein GGTG_14266 [Gaeumannomyces tritici R3-111a-1]
MPRLLIAPALKVDAEAIHRLDTRNSQNLFSVWTAPSSSAGGWRWNFNRQPG